MTKYPAGTRYCNAITYDEATDDVIEGFQVFRQCSPDGTPTGRVSILVPASEGPSNLVAVTLASQMRGIAVSNAAPSMLAALRRAASALESVSYRDKSIQSALDLVNETIEQAAGIQ